MDVFFINEIARLLGYQNGLIFGLLHHIENEALRHSFKEEYESLTIEIDHAVIELSGLIRKGQENGKQAL